MRSMPVSRIAYNREAPEIGQRDLAVEAPVALEFNGVAYAVMMATPQDLDDFAIGFTLSEKLALNPAEILDVQHAAVDGGFIVRICLAEERAEAIHERVRLRLVEGSCGLCGLDSIEQVLRPLIPITANLTITREAIGRGLSALGERQPLGSVTGAMHAAAFCSPEGNIIAVREDVGRHNALDKLVGHLSAIGLDPAEGFFILTARCSYELVEKTVNAGCPVLVTISAPTDLAVERAKGAGLTLVSLARDDGALILNDAMGRIT